MPDNHRTPAGRHEIAERHLPRPSARRILPALHCLRPSTIAQSNKSPKCARISPGVREPSATRNEAKSAGAPRKALPPRYASVASAWRRNSRCGSGAEFCAALAMNRFWLFAGCSIPASFAGVGFSRSPRKTVPSLRDSYFFNSPTQRSSAGLTSVAPPARVRAPVTSRATQPCIRS